MVGKQTCLISLKVAAALLNSARQLCTRGRDASDKMQQADANVLDSRLASAEGGFRTRLWWVAYIHRGRLRLVLAYIQFSLCQLPNLAHHFGTLSLQTATGNAVVHTNKLSILQQLLRTCSSFISFCTFSMLTSMSFKAICNAKGQSVVTLVLIINVAMVKSYP